ncbi:hypothetical protein ACFOZ5_01195 [Marinobacter lacisalsi]|uniref:Uncharacterized protein n=1 Tax=Marinobacter lacisalsi TaxID=475979 RepID=A0ABV8QF29_9GAMM
MTFDLAFAFIGVTFLIVTMLSWLVFGRLSMARIERAIMAEGKPRPCPWDGVGGRLVWYAYAVALPESFFNDIDNRQLKTSDVKRYSTRADYYRAWVFMIAGHGFVLLVAIATIFGIR